MLTNDDKKMSNRNFTSTKWKSHLRLYGHKWLKGYIRNLMDAMKELTLNG